jgi:hypothetical protein
MRRRTGGTRDRQTADGLVLRRGLGVDRRKRALERGTTVNAILNEYLEQYAAAGATASG